MISRVCQLSLRRFSSPKFTPTDYDLTNMNGLLNSDQPTISFIDKLSAFRPGTLYNTADQLSRELLFSLSDSIGLPLSIIAMSILLKGVFFYPSLKAQVMALKMKEIKPQMDKFQEKLKAAQMTNNKVMMKQAQREFSELRKKKGIDQFAAMMNFCQIPLLITWFISLRYVTTMPELFPEVQNQSFLWIEDLTQYDPFFLLPISAALISSYSISISPTMNTKTALPIMAPYLKYFRYLPFIAIPFTSLFPAALNLYWVTLASSQLALIFAVNSRIVRSQFGLIKETKRAQISQAIFIEQKGQQASSSATGSSPQAKVEHPDFESISKNVEKVIIQNKRAKKKK